MSELIKIFRIYDQVIALVVKGYIFTLPILKNVTEFALTR